MKSRGHHVTHDLSAVPSATEFGMGEDTWISSELVPGTISGHRRDPLPIEVACHMMLDLVETAACPRVSATFSPEAVHGGRVVRPDESNVDRKGRSKSTDLQASLEYWSDQPFEITAEQLRKEGLVE